MSDDQHDTGSARGEAAWKEAREQVADRNAKARKAGRAEREDYERQRTVERQTAERRRMAELLAKSN